MDERAKGLIALISACTIWGLSAIYYKTMTHIAPLEILGHRTLWSLVFFTAVLVLQGRAREILTALGSPRQFGLMALAGVLIATNWGFFILSVQMGRVVEASFGYYIFPLVAVALGAVFLGERLRPAQWISVSLALGAVVVLSVAQGIVPLISLILAGSFGVYGLIKRVIKVGPVVSVTCEVAILAPLAMIYLVGAHFWDWSGGAAQVGGVFGHAWRDSLLLMFSGVITGGPLILFSSGHGVWHWPRRGWCSISTQVCSFCWRFFCFLHRSPAGIFCLLP